MVTLYRYLTNSVFAGKCTMQHTLFITLSDPTNRAIQSTSNKSFLFTFVQVRCNLLYAACKPVADIKGANIMETKCPTFAIESKSSRQK